MTIYVTLDAESGDFSGWDIIQNGTDSDNGGADEIQLLSMGGTVNSGTFTLSHAAETTLLALPYNATAGQVQTALRGFTSLANWPFPSVVCTGGPLPGTAITIDWTCQTPITLVTATSSLGGTSPTVSVSRSQPGVMGYRNSLWTIANSPARNGTKSYHIVTGGRTVTDYDYGGSLIANFPTVHTTPGETTYIGWSCYFPSSNRGIWPSPVWDFNNVFETTSLDGGFFPRANPMSLEINTGDYGTTDPRLQFEHSLDNTGAESTRFRYWVDDSVYSGPSTAFPYDQWVDVVLKVVWSTSATGEIQLWLNGVSKFDWTTIRTVKCDGTNFSVGGENLQWQWYHLGDLNTTHFYLDEVRVASTFAEADPATYVSVVVGGGGRRQVITY